MLQAMITEISPTVAKLRVAAFESRLANEMARLISKNGGQATVTPTVREIPLEVNREALKFAAQLSRGQIDIVIFMTGVGTRFLAKIVKSQYSEVEFTAILKKVTLVARGPKPVKALAQLGLKPHITIPEPNTWREILTTLDRAHPVKNKKVAVQEYGIPNLEFLDALKVRGAQVYRVPVYQWALPEDTYAIRQTLESIAEREQDVLIFTNAAQVVHLIEVADQHGLKDSFLEACEECVIASVGPTTSEVLKKMGLPVDFEPSHSKMGILVKEALEAAPQILKKKKRALKLNPKAVLAQNTASQDALYNSPFMKACRREKTDYTPIWLMRQAGRYMAEYRKIRARHGILEIAKTPELACEVTVTAVERLGVDAAIIFADILLIAEPMGVGLEFVKGEGPVIHRPLRSESDVELLQKVEPEKSLSFVFDAIKLTRQALKPNIPLIGFCAAPFTLASYLVEGGPSKDYRFSKTLMRSHEKTWHRLMEIITEATIEYLNGQIRAGSQAVQIFDSWVGTLSPSAYQRYVHPHSQRLISSVTQGTPVIHFGTGNPALLEEMTSAGGDVIGVDWRVELDEAWKRIGYDRAIMGNMDPMILLTDPKTIQEEAKRIITQAAGRPGHIFNLGHGVIPQVPVDHAIALVEAVHA
jgi:uroporphyrinogen decarboxylase